MAERDRALTERERQLTAVHVQLNEQHSKAMNAEMRLGQKEQALEVHICACWHGFAAAQMGSQAHLQAWLVLCLVTCTFSLTASGLLA